MVESGDEQVHQAERTQRTSNTITEKTTTSSGSGRDGARPSPVLLRLWLALHGSQQGGGQLALFPHLQARVAHFDVDNGEIL